MSRFMRFVLYLVLVASAIVFAGGTGESGDFNTSVESDLLDRTSGMASTSSVGLFLDMGDSENTEPVDLIVRYDLSLRLANEYYRILDMSYDRIWLETHAGFVSETRFDDEKAFYGPMIAFRLNLFESKIPRAGTMLARISAFNVMLASYGLELRDEDRRRIDSIQRELEDYLDSRFYKRIGVGFGFPYLATTDRVEDYETMDYLWGNFVFDRSYLFVAYDPVDFISLHAGVNYWLESVVVGVSFDISTPIRSSADGFNEWLTRLIGIY